MKSPIQLVRITVMLLIVGGLADFTGCESLQDTSFAPLDCKLEPISGGGAQYFVLINTSGQTLHHLSLSGDIWYDQAITFIGNNPGSIPVRLPIITYKFNGSKLQLEPSKEIRIRRDLSPISAEGSILYPVSRVQIAGRCDEGSFREDWQINGAGQLQPMGIGAHKE
jgi:hypothetical protein